VFWTESLAGRCHSDIFYISREGFYCEHPQEFYADGQPMCSHRQINAGVENGTTTDATIEKAVIYLENMSGPIHILHGSFVQKVSKTRHKLNT